MTISDEMLMAFIDGELGPADAAKVEAALASDPALPARLEAHMRLKDRIAGHYAPVADEPVPERFRALLEPKADVVDIAAARAARERRRFLPGWGSAGAIAASLAVGVIVGQLVRPDGGIVAERSGSVVAVGELRTALGTQLASLQPADADVRIGVTFRAAGGEVCRTFEADAAAGIACREGGDWTLRHVQSASARQTAEYRQASSASIMAAAQAMMAGEALDADAERAARDAGWK